MDFKSEVAKLIEKEASLDSPKITSLLETPPDPRLGDFAFPCFVLAKEMKKAPNVIAEDLAKKIKPEGLVSKIKAAGPYLNFFADKNKMGESVLKEIITSKSCFGSQALKHKTVVVEFPAPNTNKPLHLGHVRNMLLGSSLCNILAFAGYKAVPVNWVNDRGIHICKSMLAYKKWGGGKEPNKKSDHFVGDYYVLYSEKEKENPEILDEAKEILKKWEKKDKEIMALWNKMNKWAFKGFDQTYKLFDVYHKKSYYESELYTHGKEVIKEGMEKGIFIKNDEGAIIVDLEKYKLGKKILLRSDGTSVYVTSDLSLAGEKFKDFNMDKSIHVVGNEQIHYFKVLFKVLELLGRSYAKGCYHLAHGMISLPDGKMKSREGKIVDADDLAEEIKNIASKEIITRHRNLNEEEVKKRAEIIGIGALKFFILKYDPVKDFTYNPDESISFEGETGPYVQYAHARICSMLRQVKKLDPEKVKVEFTHEKEFKLITLMNDFRKVVNEAAENYKPSLIARYALELAQSFNVFYQACPVLKEKGKTKDSRLFLITCVKQVIVNSLDLLGIKSPEEM